MSISGSIIQFDSSTSKIELRKRPSLIHHFQLFQSTQPVHQRLLFRRFSISLLNLRPHSVSILSFKVTINTVILSYTFQLSFLIRCFFLCFSMLSFLFFFLFFSIQFYFFKFSFLYDNFISILFTFFNSQLLICLIYKITLYYILMLILRYLFTIINLFL